MGNQTEFHQPTTFSSASSAKSLQSGANLLELGLPRITSDTDGKTNRPGIPME
jgi:hypothetical protein